ncbi:hypothetical protein ACHAQH_002995 [Verticillium albo-atrum]
MAETKPEALAAALLAQYRAAFKAEVAAGRANPLNIPYHFIPAFVLPILYMAVPHTKRPWLYAARWFVLAVIVAFNLDMVRNTSSTNIAISYATGLWAFWSIMHNLTMLVWMRPQFEAERVRRWPKPAIPKSGISNGHAHTPATKQTKASTKKTAPGADVEKYDYTWQAFPASAPYAERLYWSFELFATFRGAGWSWAIPGIPSPQRPEKPLAGEPVLMDTVPLVSKSGYATYPTDRAFNTAKLRAVAIAYLTVDLLKVTMMKDPYFIMGSAAAASHPVPHHLALLPPWLLQVVRHLMLLSALYAAITGLLSLHDLAQRHIVSYFIPARAELWQYSSVFGSPHAVLDRGLAGFWSAWWHQTFRVAFAGPGAFLVRMGHFAPRSQGARIVALAGAFLQSGLLHGCGSATALPRTRVWYPMLFFGLAGMGIVLQRAVCGLLASWIGGMPRAVRRVGNLAVVVLWLHFTVWPLAEDFATAGIWLLEPVPVSFVRMLGGGLVDHGVWRIDWDACPHWITGGYWWQSGIGG